MLGYRVSAGTKSPKGNIIGAKKPKKNVNKNKIEIDRILLRILETLSIFMVLRLR